MMIHDILILYLTQVLQCTDTRAYSTVQHTHEHILISQVHGRGSYIHTIIWREIIEFYYKFSILSVTFECTYLIRTFNSCVSVRLYCSRSSSVSRNIIKSVIYKPICNVKWWWCRKKGGIKNWTLISIKYYRCKWKPIHPYLCHFSNNQWKW